MVKTFTDDCGGVYSADRKTLLRCPNVESYRVAEGTLHLHKAAFRNCCFLQEVELPWTIDQSVNYMEDDITNEEYDDQYVGCSDLMQELEELDAEGRARYARAWHKLFDGHRFFIPFTVIIIQWEHPYSEEVYETHCTMKALRESYIDEHGVRYSKDGKRLLCFTIDFENVIEYTIPEGVVTIAENYFVRSPVLPLTLHLPSTVKVINPWLLKQFNREGTDLILDVEKCKKEGAEYDDSE